MRRIVSNTPVAPRAVSAAGRVSGALFVGAGAFQVALAAGMPWGHLAWGGGHPGVLPVGLRAASAANAVLLSGLGVALAGLVERPPVRGRLVAGGLAVSGFSLVANLATPSSTERAIWAPFALAQLVLLGTARRAEADRSPCR